MLDWGKLKMFENRTKAGGQLAKKLWDQFASKELATSNVLVVGLPRGGVPVALEVARRFSCPLEIIVSKKLAYPRQPEFAIGAVSSDGLVVISPDLPHEPDWEQYVEEQCQKLLEKTAKTEREFYQAAGRERSSFKDKVVIVVDDGVATGMTAMAAVDTARNRGATKVIMAAPVMSTESFYDLGPRCDDVVAISVPKTFLSVGQHYLDFGQTSDQEVVNALRSSINFGRKVHA